MNKLFLYIFLILIFSNNTNAEPIWETSYKWSCKIKLHTIIKTNGEVMGINTIKNTTIFDFKNNEVEVLFDDGYSSAGSIVEKYYVKNKIYKESIIVVNWEGWGEYTSIISESGNVYWKSKTSGYSDLDKELYTAHSECKPIN